MQAVSILKCGIVAGEGSSKPTMLSSFHSLSFSDVLLATGVALEHILFLCPLVYLPRWKIPLDENRFLQAGNEPENTKEKSRWCFTRVSIGQIPYKCEQVCKDKIELICN
jgi:hypothetical protein